MICQKKTPEAFRLRGSEPGSGGVQFAKVKAIVAAIPRLLWLHAPARYRSGNRRLDAHLQCGTPSVDSHASVPRSAYIALSKRQYCMTGQMKKSTAASTGSVFRSSNGSDQTTAASAQMWLPPRHRTVHPAQTTATDQPHSQSIRIASRTSVGRKLWSE